MFFKPQENHKKTGNNFNPFYHNFHEKEISKSGEKLTEKKGNLLADHVETPFLNFFKSIFIVKQVVL